MRSISFGVGYFLLLPYWTIAFAWACICLIIYVLNEIMVSVNAYLEGDGNIVHRYVDLTSQRRIVFRGGFAQSFLIVVLGWLGSLAFLAILYWIGH